MVGTSNKSVPGMAIDIYILITIVQLLFKSIIIFFNGYPFLNSFLSLLGSWNSQVIHQGQPLRLSGHAARFTTLASFKACNEPEVGHTVDGPAKSWTSWGMWFILVYPIIYNWLVVYLPFWKMWVRQLGLFFPIYGKTMFQTTNQIIICFNHPFGDAEFLPSAFSWTKGIIP